MNIALIMAGGTGTRMNHSTPKQYLLLNGAPIVLHTLRAFERCSAIDAICLACASSYLPLMQRMIQEHHLTKVRYFAEAGKDRRLTSKNAVEAVAPFCAPEDILLIHRISRRRPPLCHRAYHSGKHPYGAGIRRCLHRLSCSGYHCAEP